MNATLTVRYEDNTSDIYDVDSTKKSFNEIDGYLQMCIRDSNNINQAITKLGDEIDKVGALSAAMAGLHPLSLIHIYCAGF